MARAETSISYRLADGRFAGAADVRRAVADARGQASARGRSRRTRSGPSRAELEDAWRTAREAREREQAERAAARQEEWEKERARREDEARCRRKFGRLAPVRIRHRPAKPIVFTFPRVWIPRSRRRGPAWGPSVGADGFASLVLKVWSYGTHRQKGRGLFAAKALYVLDPEKLDGPPGRAIMTNLIARDAPGVRPSEYAPEWLAELFGRCDALEQFERDVARREKGQPRAQLFLHVMVALPNLPDVFLRQQAARAVVARLEKAGLPYLAVMQRPSTMRGQRDGRNHHLHLLVSTRPFEAEAPASTRVSLLKDLDTLGPEGLRAWRREIVDGFNAALDMARLPQRYTALTLAERGLDRRGRWINPPVVRAPVAPGPVEVLAAAAASLAAAAGRLASASTRLAAAAAAHGQALAKAWQAQAGARDRLAHASTRLGSAVAGAARALAEGIGTVQLARRRRALLGLRRIVATRDHAGALALGLDAGGDAERRRADVSARLGVAVAEAARALAEGIGTVQLARRRRALLGLRRIVATRDHAGALALGLDAWSDARGRLAGLRLRLEKAGPSHAEGLEGGVDRADTLSAQAADLGRRLRVASLWRVAEVRHGLGRVTAAAPAARLADLRARLAQALALLRAQAEGRVAALERARHQLRELAAARRRSVSRFRPAEAERIGAQRRLAIDLSQRIAAAVEARREALARDIADLGNARAHAGDLGRRRRTADTERLMALAAEIEALERSRERTGAARSRLAEARTVVPSRLVEALHRLQCLGRQRAEARRRLAVRLAALRVAAAAGLPRVATRGAAPLVTAMDPVGPGTPARPALLLRLAEASRRRAQAVGRHGDALGVSVETVSVLSLRLLLKRQRLDRVVATQRARLDDGVEAEALTRAGLAALSRRREDGLARTLATVHASLASIEQRLAIVDQAARRRAERLCEHAARLCAELDRLLVLRAQPEALRQRALAAFERQQALALAEEKHAAARREAGRQAEASAAARAEAERQVETRHQADPGQERLHPVHGWIAWPQGWQAARDPRWAEPVGQGSLVRRSSGAEGRGTPPAVDPEAGWPLADREPPRRPSLFRRANEDNDPSQMRPSGPVGDFLAACEAGMPAELLEDLVRRIRAEGLEGLAAAALPGEAGLLFRRIAEDQAFEEAQDADRRRRDAEWSRGRDPWDD